MKVKTRTQTLFAICALDDQNIMTDSGSFRVYKGQYLCLTDWGDLHVLSEEEMSGFADGICPPEGDRQRQKLLDMLKTGYA